jgi:hypothetical protein
MSTLVDNFFSLGEIQVPNNGGRDMNKIPPEALGEVAESVFGEESPISGRKIAEQLGTGYASFWTYLRTRGMDPRFAHKLATALDGEASRLRTAARELRRLAREA